MPRLSITLYCLTAATAVLNMSAYASPPPQDPDQVDGSADALLPEVETYVIKRGFRTRVNAAELVRNQSQGALGEEIFGAPPITRGGSVRGLVEIPVFPFLYAETPSAPFAARNLENTLYGTAPNQRSVTTHYREISHGLLTLSGTVRPWVRSPYSQAQTVKGHPQDSRYQFQMGRTFANVLKQSDDAVDFGRYDNDGPDGVPNSGDDDGVVDFVAFVHPERGQECDGKGAVPRKIWSHKWSLEYYPEGAYITNDISQRPGNPKIRVAEYVVQPAMSCKLGGIIEIGVFAHEYGHAFGLPDLYDTSYQTSGISSWGLMGAGSWGGQRNTPDKPIHMLAWAKEYLGWIRPRTIRNDVNNVVLRSYARSGDAVRIDYTSRYDPSDQRYLLLTYRTPDNFDDTLPGSGILLTEINNFSIQAGQLSNKVNAVKGAHGVKVVEANGGNELDGPSVSAKTYHMLISSAGRDNLPVHVAQNLGATICNVRMDADRVVFDVKMDRVSCDPLFGVSGVDRDETARTAPSVLEDVLTGLIKNGE